MSLFFCFLIGNSIESICPCDTGGNKCSPYCGCARSCVDGETSILNLLYDQPNRYFIGCDLKNELSISRYTQAIEINGVKCYILDKYNDKDIIESYTAEQFGLTNFSSSVLRLQQMTEPLNTAQAAYNRGDNIIYTFNNNSPIANGTVLIPRAIGSNECNAYIPVSHMISSPIQTCVFSERYKKTGSRLYIYDLGYTDIEGVHMTPEVDSIKNITGSFDDNVLNTFYMFNNDFTSDPNRINDKYDATFIEALQPFVESATQYAPGIIPTFTSSMPIITIGEKRNFYYPYDKAGTNHGYEYGSPMIYHDNIYVVLGNKYIRFGSNSDYVINNGTTLKIVDNFESIINDQWRIAPSGMGNLGTQLLRFERDDLQNPKIDEPCQLNFYYKKYDLVQKSGNDIVQYPNQNVLVYLKASGFCNLTADPLHVQTKFIEINPYTNNTSTHTYSKPYSATFGMIFDFMFETTDDAIKTIGILFCFGLAGTIWIYTGFCFDYSS